MFDEDLSLFFDTDDFAVRAVIKRGTTFIIELDAIFTAASQSVEIYDAEIEEPLPTLMVRSGDISGVRRGDAVTVSGSSFRVEKITPDGTGVSIVFLAAL